MFDSPPLPKPSYGETQIPNVVVLWDETGLGPDLIELVSL
jgi:hypothetical protein